MQQTIMALTIHKYIYIYIGTVCVKEFVQTSNSLSLLTARNTEFVTLHDLGVRWSPSWNRCFWRLFGRKLDRHIDISLSRRGGALNKSKKRSAAPLYPSAMWLCPKLSAEKTYALSSCSQIAIIWHNVVGFSHGIANNLNINHIAGSWFYIPWYPVNPGEIHSGRCSWARMAVSEKPWLLTHSPVKHLHEGTGSQSPGTPKVAGNKKAVHPPKCGISMYSFLVLIIDPYVAYPFVLFCNFKMSWQASPNMFLLTLWEFNIGKITIAASEKLIYSTSRKLCCCLRFLYYVVLLLGLWQVSQDFFQAVNMGFTKQQSFHGKAPHFPTILMTMVRLIQNPSSEPFTMTGGPFYILGICPIIRVSLSIQEKTKTRWWLQPLWKY